MALDTPIRRTAWRIGTAVALTFGLELTFVIAGATLPVAPDAMAVMGSFASIVVPVAVLAFAVSRQPSTKPSRSRR